MKSILIAVVTLFAMQVFAVEVPKNLLDAIVQVESDGNNSAVGDKGKAIGRFQIWKTYVDECNRIIKLKKLGKSFSYEDRLDSKKSEEMVVIYLSFWGDQYERKTGNKATLEVLAKIHNGHAFWNRSRSNPKNNKYFRNLESYWNKVKKALQ